MRVAKLLLLFMAIVCIIGDEEESEDSWVDIDEMMLISLNHMDYLGDNTKHKGRVTKATAAVNFGHNLAKVADAVSKSGVTTKFAGAMGAIGKATPYLGALGAGLALTSVFLPPPPSKEHLEQMKKLEEISGKLDEMNEKLDNMGNKIDNLHVGQEAIKDSIKDLEKTVVSGFRAIELRTKAQKNADNYERCSEALHKVVIFINDALRELLKYQKATVHGRFCKDPAWHGSCYNESGSQLLADQAENALDDFKQRFSYSAFNKFKDNLRSLILSMSGDEHNLFKCSMLDLIYKGVPGDTYGNFRGSIHALIVESTYYVENILKGVAVFAAHRNFHANERVRRSATGYTEDIYGDLLKTMATNIIAKVNEASNNMDDNLKASIELWIATSSEARGKGTSPKNTKKARALSAIISKAFPEVQHEVIAYNWRKTDSDDHSGAQQTYLWKDNARNGKGKYGIVSARSAEDSDSSLGIIVEYVDSTHNTIWNSIMRQWGKYASRTQSGTCLSYKYIKPNTPAEQLRCYQNNVKVPYHPKWVRGVAVMNNAKPGFAGTLEGNRMWKTPVTTVCHVWIGPSNNKEITRSKPQGAYCDWDSGNNPRRPTVYDAYPHTSDKFTVTNGDSHVTVRRENGNSWAMTLILECTCPYSERHNECQPEYGVDYQYHDVTSHHNTVQWWECNNHCKADSRCKYWTWNWHSRVCYLKSAKGPITHNHHAYSGCRKFRVTQSVLFGWKDEGYSLAENAAAEDAAAEDTDTEDLQATNVEDTTTDFEWGLLCIGVASALVMFYAAYRCYLQHVKTSDEGYEAIKSGEDEPISVHTHGEVMAN